MSSSIHNDKEVRATLFSQWASIGELIINDKRDGTMVSKILQSIIMSPSPSCMVRLKVHTRKALKRIEVKTVVDLVQYSKEELLTARNFGMQDLQDVREMLAIEGLKLKGD